VASPGTEIVAALGFNFEDDEEWIAMTGTSMASPFVCGLVGLMLAENPRLTASQIRGILQRTSRPLPNADFSWRDDAGCGVVDPQACLDEVRQLAQVEHSFTTDFHLSTNLICRSRRMADAAAGRFQL